MNGLKFNKNMTQNGVLVQNKIPDQTFLNKILKIILLSNSIMIHNIKTSCYVEFIPNSTINIKRFRYLSYIYMS